MTTPRAAGMRSTSTALQEYPFDVRVRTLQSPDADPKVREIAFAGIIGEYGPRMQRRALLCI